MAKRRRDPIVLYRGRFWLLGGASVQLVLAGVASLFVYMGVDPTRRHPPTDLLLAAIAALLGLLPLLVMCFLLYHVVARRPALVVDSSGIYDDCSLLFTGVGLIRWDEIAELAPLHPSKAHNYVIITTRDDAYARQPLSKRLLRRVRFHRPSSVAISFTYFSLTPDTFLRDVRLRFEAQLRANDIQISGFGVPQLPPMSRRRKPRRDPHLLY